MSHGGEATCDGWSEKERDGEHRMAHEWVLKHESAPCQPLQHLMQTSLGWLADAKRYK